MRTPGRRSVVGRWLAPLLGAVLLLSGGPAAAEEALNELGGKGRLAERDLASRDTIVIVWASWSPRSRDIAERVNEVSRRWSAKARVVTVNFQEDEETVRKFQRGGTRIEVPIFLDVDGGFSRRHRVATLPGLLVSQGGEIAFSGKMPSTVDDELKQIFGEP